MWYIVLRRDFSSKQNCSWWINCSIQERGSVVEDLGFCSKCRLNGLHSAGKDDARCNLVLSAGSTLLRSSVACFIAWCCFFIVIKYIRHVLWLAGLAWDFARVMGNAMARFWHGWEHWIGGAFLMTSMTVLTSRIGSTTISSQSSFEFSLPRMKKIFHKCKRRITTRLNEALPILSSSTG